MQPLIDLILAGIAPDATREQKAAGAQACRTIAAALDTEPGKPLTIATSAPAPSPLAGISLDQILNLVIARLGVVAKDREERQAQQTPAVPTATVAPRGLRVPMATSPLLQAATAPRPRAPQRPTRSSPARVPRPAPRTP